MRRGPKSAVVLPKPPNNRLTHAMACFLVQGCSGLVCEYVDLGIYWHLHPPVMKGDLSRLRELWKLHGAMLRAGYPERRGQFFAELVLGGMPFHEAEAKANGW